VPAAHTSIKVLPWHSGTYDVSHTLCLFLRCYVQVVPGYQAPCCQATYIYIYTYLSISKCIFIGIYLQLTSSTCSPAELSSLCSNGRIERTCRARPESGLARPAQLRNQTCTLRLDHLRPGRNRMDQDQQHQTRPSRSCRPSEFGVQTTDPCGDAVLYVYVHTDCICTYRIHHMNTVI
jgi:hypothetical protein